MVFMKYKKIVFPWRLEIGTVKKIENLTHTLLLTISRDKNRSLLDCEWFGSNFESNYMDRVHVWSAISYTI